MSSRSSKSPNSYQSTKWEARASPGWVEWLEQCDLSLAVTTYQAGKLLLVGRSAQGRLKISERSFPRAMGVWTDGQTVWLATAYQLWRLEHEVDQRKQAAGFDRLFVPRLAHTTGDLDLHDVALDAKGRPLFVATLFNCLATVSDRHSFEPVWRPPFISDLTAEDRCHLNGLAMIEGKPKYVTICAATDVRKGWKSHRADGGQLLDVESGEAIVTGLSMPHSPRWHNGRLWMLNSGAGGLGVVDLATGRYEEVAFCPGFARGLAFVDHYAIVGLSRPREKNRFGGLELDNQLALRDMNSCTGLVVIDLNSGQTVHTLNFEGRVAELYDVATLPGITRPTLLGLQPKPLRYNAWASPEETSEETKKNEQKASVRHWRRPAAGG